LQGGRCSEAEVLRSDVEACVSQEDWFRMLRSPGTRCDEEMVGCWLTRCEPDGGGKLTMSVRLGVVWDRDPDAPRWDSERRVDWGRRGRPLWEGKRMLELMTEGSRLYLRFTGPRHIHSAGTL
jgi:hypothetical protein